MICPAAPPARRDVPFDPCGYDECTHCGNQLPDVVDAFCPHCRGALANVKAGEADAVISAGRRNRLWISVVVAAGLALLFLPFLTFPLAALVFLGVACARSAIVNRQVGWMMGLILGIVLAVAGLAGMVVVFVLRLWRNS